MGAKTGISWCHHTFNPWTGCFKVSPGCDHCYAEGIGRRFGLGSWGEGGGRRIASEPYWEQVWQWRRSARRAGVRRRVFCASMADVFEDHPLVVRSRARLWDYIKLTQNDLDWLLLTKRPENIAAMLPNDWGEGYPNVWLGVTAENQEWAGRRIPALLKVPARLHFVSVEPMLGPVNLLALPYDGGRTINALEGIVRSADGTYHKGSADCIDWVICGGESGPGARPMHPKWAMDLRDQVLTTWASFHFKQWGEWAPISLLWPRLQSGAPNPARPPYGKDAWGKLYADGRYEAVTTTWNGRQLEPDDDYAVSIARVGTAAAGHLLDGREWREVPEVEA